jgi:hypothetical protein
MEPHDVRAGGRAFRSGVMLLGLLLVGAQLVQAWSAWQRDVVGATPTGVTPGDLISVTLVNGQVYYGNLARIDAHHISLDDVYYVQTAVDTATNQRSNRLVSRKRTDWHAPLRMTIPADKLLLVEQVGPGSQLVQLMEQDRRSAPQKPP